jgi:hypothetical protein
MSEEATQDTGSQGAASASAATAAAPVGFLDSLPEDLRGEPSLRHFTDPAALAKSYVHAQRMIGADKIPLPGKSATEEDWANVWAKLGRPQSPSDYQIKFENQALADGELEGFRKSAFEAGLNNSQVDRMARFLEETVTTANTSRSEMAEKAVYEAEQELRQEFGQAFEQRMTMAYNAAKQLLGDADLLDEVQLADGRMLGDHPQVVRMFAKLAEQIGEDQLLGEASELIMTPQEATQRITEMTRRDSPYWDKLHPEHDTYVAEVLRLREYA